MSISVTAGAPPYRDDFAVETLTQTGATIGQVVALTVPLTTISGGTGTGFETDVFTLSTATAVEGQEKVILMLATGEAKVALTGTATGRFVLSQADDMIVVRFLRSKWRVFESSATIATAT